MISEIKINGVETNLRNLRKLISYKKSESYKAIVVLIGTRCEEMGIPYVESDWFPPVDKSEKFFYRIPGTPSRVSLWPLKNFIDEVFSNPIKVKLGPIHFHDGIVYQIHKEINGGNLYGKFWFLLHGCKRYIGDLILSRILSCFFANPLEKTRPGWPKNDIVDFLINMIGEEFERRGIDYSRDTEKIMKEIKRISSGVHPQDMNRFLDELRERLTLAQVLGFSKEDEEEEE